MEGENLNEQKVVLPADARGKFTLLGIAYSQKAQEDLETWVEPVYYEFIDKSGFNSLVYDVNVYLVMMFTGSNKVVYEKAREKIKEGTDKEFFKHTFLYKGELESYEEKLRLPDRDTPAFYVLDKDGKIIHMTEGSYTARKLEKIGELVEN